jgi:large repetitive protein
LDIPASDALTPASTIGGFNGVYNVVATVTDLAGNTSSDSTSAELTVQDTTAPAIDLDPSAAGTLDHGVTSANGAAVSLDDAADAATVIEASDLLGSITITVGGLLDGSNEKLVFGTTTIAADGSSGTQADILAGGVRINVSYAGGVFTVQKYDFSTLSAAEAQAVIRDVQYRDAAVAFTTGSRTFAFRTVDDAGNVSTVATATVSVTDTIAPVIDLDPTAAGTGDGTATDRSVTSANGALVSLDDNADAVTVVEAVDRLTEVRITVGGLQNGVDEQLVFGATTVTADGSSGAQTDIAVGGVQVDISYTAGVFTIVRHDGAQLTAAQAQAIMADVQYQNTATVFTAGSRTFGFAATDKAGNASAITTATVNVVDTTAPVVAASQTFGYSENRAADDVVGTVAATDTFGVTGFRFSASGTATSADGYFTIDSDGDVHITTAGAAAAANDFESAANSWTYGVQARDAAGNWSTAQNVTLSETNIDEVAPTITSGTTAAAVAENSGANQIVYTATATDSADTSAGVTWSLSGTDAAAFTIDATTGLVKLTGNPTL